MLEGKFGASGEQLDLFVARAQIQVEPVTAEPTRIAQSLASLW